MGLVRNEEFADFVENPLANKSVDFGNLSFVNDPTLRFARVYSYNLLVAVADRHEKKVHINEDASGVSVTTSRHLNSVLRAKSLLGDYIFLDQSKDFLGKLF